MCPLAGCQLWYKPPKILKILLSLQWLDDAHVLESLNGEQLMQSGLQQLSGATHRNSISYSVSWIIVVQMYAHGFKLKRNTWFLKFTNLTYLTKKVCWLNVGPLEPSKNWDPLFGELGPPFCSLKWSYLPNRSDL